VRKKRKYETEELDITLTEDDVELVVDKVQDRGEKVVRIVEVQEEEIMENLLEIHENIQQLQIQEGSHATMQQRERTQ
jgi:nitrogen regulatory protein PII-like uncharacterized protein